ncbi:hypothetical protein [Candidatus Thioglobus sp.]|uniref:hypothetical protein n=1 Tax=Candidatus Thioglobus sp. TaxID=2026721 RepID=UPI003D136815
MNSTNNWKEKKERSNPFALNLICWLALNISRGFARFWLYPITLYFFLTSSQVRRASKNYLKRLKPLGGHGFIEVLKHIYYFSCVILDRVYFITGKTDQFDIKIFNESLVSNLVKNNSSFILLGSHIGGFDILQYLTPKYGQAKIMMDLSHNSMITDILYNLNPVMFEAIIDANSSNSLLKIKESLDEEKFVALLADRHIDGQKAIQCSFLGGDVNISKFPFALAHILKKPVVVFFGIYMGGNKYEIHFKELSSGLKQHSINKEDNIERDAQLYMTYIQNMLEQHPFNWFNFYDYWQDE